MQPTSVKKNKVALSDYDYRQDIEHRIWLSQLSVSEVDTLREVVYGSLQTNVKELAQLLCVEPHQLEQPLQKLQDYEIISRSGDQVIVDKELRKYFEPQVERFDEDFQPGLSYLRDLLAKVPIHVLPNWYALPRMTDSIFTSIVEKYLQTPKIYEQYLSELSFEDPVLHHIVEDVMTAEDFCIRSKDLREKYSLSRAEFEECILYLEFNFVCCISYRRIDDMWKEVVTPFHEWHSYLRHLQNTLPKTIAPAEEIDRAHPSDFGFVEDLEKLLHAAERGQVVSSSPFLEKAVQAGFLASEGVSLEGREWLYMSPSDKAISIYRNRSCLPNLSPDEEALYTDRNLRLIERALRRVVDHGWISFTSFLKSIVEPIGNSEPIKLVRNGRGQWCYQIPKLGPVEKDLIEKVIFERLFQTGIVATGFYLGESCFTVTPFGRTTLVG